MSRTAILTRLLAAALLLPQAAAAGTFRPPAGCEGFVTVQQRSCKVSNHYRCAADPPGDQRRTDFGINGAYFQSRIDREAQWIESRDSDGTIDMLELPAADPASFSELLATGLDRFDFTTLNSSGRREHIIGYDRLSGETVVIDGVTLQRTKYDVTATGGDGRMIWSARGGEFIHADWRLFLSGAGQVDLGEGWLPQDFTPVDFVFPGEPGFFTTIPLYDCDPITASYPGARSEEYRDDL